MLSRSESSIQAWPSQTFTRAKSALCSFHRITLTQIQQGKNVSECQETQPAIDWLGIWRAVMIYNVSEWSHSNWQSWVELWKERSANLKNTELCFRYKQHTTAFPKQTDITEEAVTLDHNHQEEHCRNRRHIWKPIKHACHTFSFKNKVRQIPNFCCAITVCLMIMLEVLGRSKPFCLAHNYNT